MNKFKLVNPSWGDIEILSVWKKGKKKDSPLNFMVEAKGNGIFQPGKHLLFQELGSRFNIPTSTIDTIEKDHFIIKTPNHMKHWYFNYYKIDMSPEEMESEFIELIKSHVKLNPLIHVGGYRHMLYDDLNPRPVILADENGKQVV